MKIAVVLNYKSCKESIICTERLFACGIDRVVVVDNNSKDGSVEKLQRNFTDNYRVTVLESGLNKGYASGNNLGLEFIENEFGISNKNTIFIVNPDSIVNEKLINSIEDFSLEHTDSGMVTGIVDHNCSWLHLTPKRAFIFNFYFLRWILFKLGIKENKKQEIKGNHAQRVEVVTGAFFGINQATFKSVEYFDTNTFLYYEEEILSTKLERIHKYSYVLPYVQFAHEGGGSRTTGKYNFKKNNEKSKLYYLTNYCNTSKKYIFIMKLVNKIDNFFLKIFLK